MLGNQQAVTRVKLTDEQKRIRRNTYQAKYRANNPEKVKAWAAKSRELITIGYVASMWRWPVARLREYPELFETKKIHLLITRELRK